MAHNSTGVVSKWVLVHDGSDVLARHENVLQETVATQTIETFDTEAEIDARIVELDLIPLPEEELGE